LWGQALVEFRTFAGTCLNSQLLGDLLRSYFVLDNIPSSDYISDELPGRRPNPAQLIDIVNRTFGPSLGGGEACCQILEAANNMLMANTSNGSSFKQKAAS
jgi:hypothetical protein